MNLKKVIYYWWYLFFSAYWTAFHLGERDEPESNAIYYFNLLIGFHLFGIMQLIKFLGYDFSISVLVGICVFPAIAIPYFSFKKGNRYIKKIDDFKFLKDTSYAKKRHSLLIILSFWSIIFVAIGGIIRMN
jgi:hypothetical protein